MLKFTKVYNTLMEDAAQQLKTANMTKRNHQDALANVNTDAPGGNETKAALQAQLTVDDIAIQQAKLQAKKETLEARIATLRQQAVKKREQAQRQQQQQQEQGTNI